MGLFWSFYAVRTSLQAIDLLVLPLGLVALGDDGRDPAHRSGQQRVNGSKGVTHEQQALLTPDMAVEEQWTGRVIREIV